MTTSRATVLEAFGRLQARASDQPLSSPGYFVEQLEEGREGIFLGCSTAGELSLLVVTEASRAPLAPVRLAILSADFGVLSLLSEGGEESLVRVSSLRCSVTERGIADLFATVCAALDESLPSTPTENDFSAEINRWTGMFWRLGLRVDTDVVGLVGELVVLRRANDLGVWIAAWHANPADILDFDFVDRRASVEVKATRSNTRNHNISLEQVFRHGRSERFFASVLVELNDSGELLSALVREISDRLESDHQRLSFWSVLTKTCGAGLDEVLSRRVELDKASASLRFYRADEIPVPTVEVPLPPGVSGVKFLSDFSKAAEVPVIEIDRAVESNAST